MKELSKPEGEPVMKSQEQEIAEILRDNIHFSGQLGDYVIHGAIEKIIEWADRRSKPEPVIGERSAEEFAVKQKFLNDFLNGKTVHDLFEEYIRPQFKPKPSTLQEWISVKERLPESGQHVLCHNGFRMVENSWEQHTDQDATWFKETFTHWMPLPSPPKQEQ